MKVSLNESDMLVAAVHTVTFYEIFVQSKKIIVLISLLIDLIGIRIALITV